MFLSPTQQLMEDHELILQVLDVMERSTQKIAKGEEIQFAHWEYFVQFSREFSDGIHHHKEEQMLFPAMIHAGLPHEDGPIACMLSEHDTGRAYIQSLALALEKYKSGDQSVKMEIIENASEYIYLLRQHITKENQILFLMAEKLLSISEKKKLLNQINQWVSEEKNCHLEKKFRQNFEALLAS